MLRRVNAGATMRAVVLERPGAPLRVESVPRPRPRAGEVLVRVHGCGVCHTDLHVIKGEVAFPTPCVLGHEIAGVLEEAGPGVVGWQGGERVACAFIMPCGSCRHCARGRDDLCEAFFAMNRLRGTLYDGTSRLARADGSPLAMYSMAGLAEYAVVPASDVFALPETIELQSAAVLGCAVFTAYGAVRHAGAVSVGDRVAVVAAGGVGLNIIALARAFGASTVIAVDVAAAKLDAARSLGATDVVDASSTDPVAAVRELTGGEGVDVAFEALGRPATVEQAFRMARDGGSVVCVGIGAGKAAAAIEITHLVRRGIRLIGSFGARTRADMPRVIELAASGAIDLAALISARVGLEAADAIYQALDRGEVRGRALVVP
ncbi:MAG TPA: zinc-binding dehydrogenase [Solirubrobacteraceae bacterium]|nr:zinc-binding dehydrogenase [Solirubrobacteraceae bacterium]